MSLWYYFVYYSKHYGFGTKKKTIKSKVKPYNHWSCDVVYGLHRYRNVSEELKRGTSLRYPLKEKKRITQNLTMHASPSKNVQQLNGVDHKKELAESFSTVTIQSEVEVRDDVEHSPISNGPSKSLRQQVLTRVTSDDATTNHVAKAASLEDVNRSSTLQHPPVVSKSRSLPMEDEKTVPLPPKPQFEKDSELAQLRDTPALQFLTRKDLYKYMTSAGVRFMLVVIIFQIIIM